MSYLVLARKWRPKRFAELVGQEHVVRALTNALELDRVHHAFLFTGTRGVGKTTIARIFAKSLNCEQGTSAEPCGECSACRDIDAGRFLDLLEIDAASNTGVDDVREVIENAQYMPSRGRMKVYLIDEVHMLSKQAFNALLKTLEEPPAHVKFLLATTDPQKLPVTVLSRCLQFNLKRLDLPQIEGQIARILEAEGIIFEPAAVRLLAKAADGSLRDGLSLLDQGIAYSGSGGERALQADAIAQMLGSVDRRRIGGLLKALGDGNGETLLGEIAQLAELSPDWGGVLDALAEALHRVQVRQLVPASEVEAEGIDLDTLAGDLRPELVQLWYQMALQGRRDLPLAPTAQIGFEMSLLRMLAFRPVATAAADVAIGTSRQPANTGSASDRSAEPGRVRPARAQRVPSAAHAAPLTIAAAGTVQPAAPVGAASVTSDQAAPSVAPEQADAQSNPSPEHESVDGIADSEHWLRLVAACGAKGPAGQLAAHAAFVGYADGVLRLSLPPADELLRTPALVQQLERCLADQLGRAPQIRFEAAPGTAETLHQRSERQRDNRQAAAEYAFLSDPHVQKLMREQGARLVPDSIRPLDD